MLANRILAVSLAVLVLTASIPASVTAQGDDSTDVSVGDEGPTIEVSLDTSFFTNLPGPGAVGVTVTGRALDQVIIHVDIAVEYHGVGAADSLTDRFSTRSTTFLDLPFLGDTYERDLTDSTT